MKGDQYDMASRSPTAEPETEPEYLAEEFGTTIPQSIEAEQHVLGALLLDNLAWDRVGDILLANDFFDSRHRWIYEAIGSLVNANKPADVITVFHQVEAQGNVDKIERMGGTKCLPYINALSHSVHSAANIRRYAEIVRDKSAQRALISAMDEAGTIARQEIPIAERTDKIATLLANLQEGQVRQMPRRAEELLVERLDHYNDLAEGKVPIGISTGIPALDKALNGGLRPKRVYVLAARPSVGKSSLAQAIQLHIAGNGTTCAMLSQEMDQPECMDRSFANVGGIDYENLQNGRLTDFEWGALSEATEKIRKMPFFIDDESGLTLDTIRAKAVALRREGLKVLAIDYLQLCNYQAGKGTSTNDAVAPLSKGIKKLAKDLGLAIIVLSQLNRDVERRGSPEPNMADLRDSGAIEQDADVIMMLWHVRTFKDYRIMGLTITKNRQGKFKGRIALEFQGQYQRWLESEADITPDVRKASTSGGME